MNIGFTGHRDKLANPADILAHVPLNSMLTHGGAKGFDSQVDSIFRPLGFEIRIIAPDYRQYGSSAPLIRNRQIIASSDLLIALYDGRRIGGTFFTIREALKARKPVIILHPASS